MRSCPSAGSPWRSDPERTCREFPRTVAGRMLERELVSKLVRCAAQDRGVENRIQRCDNGPELTSRHFLAWCVDRQIELVHIQPGKPKNARTVVWDIGRRRSLLQR